MVAVASLTRDTDSFRTLSLTSGPHGFLAEPGGPRMAKTAHYCLRHNNDAYVLSYELFLTIFANLFYWMHSFKNW